MVEFGLSLSITLDIEDFDVLYLIDGTIDGEALFLVDGDVLGFIDGTFNGAALGISDGIDIGVTEDSTLVANAGAVLGLELCLVDSIEDGDVLGFIDGILDGILLELSDRIKLGGTEENKFGANDIAILGILLGLDDGMEDNVGYCALHGIVDRFLDP